MCKAIEDMKKESFDKGILIGKEEGTNNIIIKHVLSCHKKGLSNEEISNLLELSIEEVINIINTNIMMN